MENNKDIQIEETKYYSLQEAINSYKQTAEEKVENENKKNWFSNNYIYIIGGIVVVGVITIGVVYINKKRSEI